MRILCKDNDSPIHFFVLEVSAAYYDKDVNGLVLCPVNDDMDDFCYPHMHPDRCDSIVFDLFRLGVLDLRNCGVIQLYSDHVEVKDDEDDV